MRTSCSGELKMLTPDGRTDGKTDKRMERRKLYTPGHTSYAGGIIILRCSKVWAHYSLIIRCLNIGTPKNHLFPFVTNGKVVVLEVPIFKHFRVIMVPALFLPLPLIQILRRSLLYSSPLGQLLSSPVALETKSFSSVAPRKVFSF